MSTIPSERGSSISPKRGDLNTETNPSTNSNNNSNEETNSRGTFQISKSIEVSLDKLSTQLDSFEKEINSKLGSLRNLK